MLTVDLQHMWDQEKRHLAKFNEILAENRVRPTFLLPLWNISGFLLGGRGSSSSSFSMQTLTYTHTHTV